jgi:hypothetical protein
MNMTRDGYGNFAKFVPPLVANGKVYVATSSKQVTVYGLLPPPAASKSSGEGSFDWLSLIFCIAITGLRQQHRFYGEGAAPRELVNVASPSARMSANGR